MKKMVILTGPQGSGNHLWSKIFSLHPKVFGWKTLLDNYWEAHRFAEPFCEYWKDPSKLKDFDWSTHDHFFTSISVPLGIQEKKWEPNIMQFVNEVNKLGIETQIVVIGRDQNILRHQQNRLRKESTLPLFMKQLPNFPNPIFLSYELLYLYKQDYLKSLNVGIPIAWDDPRVNEILSNDPNDKYVHHVEDYFLDICNKSGTSIKSLNDTHSDNIGIFFDNPVNKELYSFYLDKNIDKFEEEKKELFIKYGVSDLINQKVDPILTYRDCENVTLVLYEPGAGGNFLINCLCLSDDVLSDINNRDQKLKLLESYYSSIPLIWKDMSLNLWFDFSIHGENDKEKYFFIPEHFIDPFYVSQHKNFWRKLNKVIYLKNSKLFTSLRRCVFRESLENKIKIIDKKIIMNNSEITLETYFRLPERLKNYLKEKFKEDMSESPSENILKDYDKVYIWDTNWFLDENETVSNLRSLYHSLNLSSFNENDIRFLYKCWMNRLVELRKLPEPENNTDSQ